MVNGGDGWCIYKEITKQLHGMTKVHVSCSVSATLHGVTEVHVPCSVASSYIIIVHVPSNVVPPLFNGFFLFEKWLLWYLW